MLLKYRFYLILVNYKTWSQYISSCQSQCACQCDYNNVSVFPVSTWAYPGYSSLSTSVCVQQMILVLFPRIRKIRIFSPRKSLLNLRVSFHGNRLCEPYLLFGRFFLSDSSPPTTQTSFQTLTLSWSRSICLTNHIHF